MLPRRFTDPFGTRLLALEKNIVKLRALEMLLVMFYVEELKRDVIDRIQRTESFYSRLSGGATSTQRVPKGIKNPVDQALNALVADGAITAAEKMEIVGFIDFRNVIGHQMHNLFVDVSPERIAHEMSVLTPELLPKYDYDAVVRLQHFQKRLDGLYRTHHYVRGMNYNRLLFRAAEKTFISDIAKTRKRISKLVKIRQEQIKRLNAELSLEGSELVGELDPQHPLSKYDDGRLTRRGIEICYRLFEMGKSMPAVAHITGLSLIATRKRRRMWTALGGLNRVREDIATIPHRKFYRLDDD